MAATAEGEGGKHGNGAADEFLPSLFNRERFVRRVRLLALAVEPRLCSEALGKLRGTLLTLPQLRPVVDSGDGSGRKLLIFGEGVAVVPDGLPPEPRAYVSALLCASPPRAAVVTHEVALDWSHVPLDAILRALLPPALCTELPSAFETVGYIAHLNLRDELRPYARTIGDVLLAKNPRTLRTVVCKTGTIESEFRTFPMRVVAGEDRLDAEVREGHCVFRFNFAEVYWNSRLQTEHARLVALFDPARDVVCDMFAGVGPFALPAAKRGCVVYANDLNPRSHHYLLRNIELNGLQDKVRASNLDGREFVR